MQSPLYILCLLSLTLNCWAFKSAKQYWTNDIAKVWNNITYNNKVEKLVEGLASSLDENEPSDIVFDSGNDDDDDEEDEAGDAAGIVYGMVEIPMKDSSALSEAEHLRNAISSILMDLGTKLKVLKYFEHVISSGWVVGIIIQEGSKSPDDENIPALFLAYALTDSSNLPLDSIGHNNYAAIWNTSKTEKFVGVLYLKICEGKTLRKLPFFSTFPTTQRNYLAKESDELIFGFIKTDALKTDLADVREKALHKCTVQICAGLTKEYGKMILENRLGFGMITSLDVTAGDDMDMTNGQVNPLLTDPHLYVFFTFFHF